MEYGYSRSLLATIGLGLLCTATAQGADAPRAAPRLSMPDPLWSLRDMYPDLANHAAATPAPTEFHAHTTAPRATDVLAGSPRALPDLPQTTPWQRLGEARVPGGVRILTLWHAAAGTFAVHAGRHGGPSLQWTSPVSARATPAHGLFDRLVAGGSSGR